MRLVLALAFPLALGRGGWLALTLFGVAAATDYVDGPLARRSGRTSRYGALLDGGADIAFVLAATGAGAWAGRLSWLAPAAIACSASAYLVASLRRTRETGRPERSYSALGHAAGVCNYVLAGLVAGAVALAWSGWPLVLGLASGLVVALNLGAALSRLPWPSRAA